MITKSERRKNRERNKAYSSFYSVLSFLCSFVYLIVDVISKSSRFSAIFAFALLILSFILCEITIRKLRIGIEQKNMKIMRWNNKLIQAAQTVGYLSYPLLTITLLVAIIRFA